MSKSHDAKIDSEKVSQIKVAIGMGYYHLDGAESYGTEQELGKAIKESKVPREKLFVTTKVSANIKDIPNAIAMSLKKLQLDYVDLYEMICTTLADPLDCLHFVDISFTILSTSRMKSSKPLGLLWKGSRKRAKLNLLASQTTSSPNSRQHSR